MTVPTEWNAEPASDCFLVVEDAIAADGGVCGTGVAQLVVVGVEEAESEVAACSDVGAVCGCRGPKCAAAAAVAVAGPLAAGGGLSGCGFVQTSLVVSCSLSILGRRRT